MPKNGRAAFQGSILAEMPAESLPLAALISAKKWYISDGGSAAVSCNQADIPTRFIRSADHFRCHWSLALPEPMTSNPPRRVQFMNRSFTGNAALSPIAFPNSKFQILSASRFSQRLHLFLQRRHGQPARCFLDGIDPRLVGDSIDLIDVPGEKCPSHFVKPSP
jgi:hypothetical protein